MTNYAPSLVLAAKAELELRRRHQPPTFREFIALVAPHIIFYPHVERIVAVLQRVADGELLRVLLELPPRHAKSELASRLFPAYYLYRHPERWVGLTSYSADLAYTLSRNARENYRRAGGELSVAGVEHWETGQRGGLWAAGIGGPITGKGFHVGIIDDPIKNAEEAASGTIREKHKDYYRSTFYTRQEPNAAIIVIQTRWHEDDLTGWLLSEEASEDETPERWHVVNMPAIAEAEPPIVPATCTVEPDPRQPGEALCPERYPLERLHAIARRIGSYFFGALFQQQPAPAEGGILKRQWWRYWQPRNANLGPVRIRLTDGTWHETAPVELPQRFDELVQSWDMAFKETATSDFVAGQVWGRLAADSFLLDFYLKRADLAGTIAAVEQMTAQWPDARTKLVEDRANGPAVMQSLRRRVPGLIAVQPMGTKEGRVHAVQPDIEAGNVYLPHPRLRPWVAALIDKCAAFPNVAHDDEVDAMTQALLRLSGRSGTNDTALLGAFSSWG